MGLMSVFGFDRSETVEERNGMTMLTLNDARAAYEERLVVEAKQREDELVEKRVQEALGPQLFALTAGDPSDARFRRITSPQTLRDLNPLMHDRMQQVCFFLAVTTPFGKRIVEIITDYVVGDGMKVICEDPRAQAIVDRFWDDEINNMPERIRSMCGELTTFGEYCGPVAVNPVDGFVRMGYKDPQVIESIQYGIMTTADGDQEMSFPINVILRRETNEDTNFRRMPIIRTDEDVNSPSYGQLTGACFYFAINKAMSASRGLSELFSLADWIDVFDQMIFDFADKVRFLNSFVWHYTLNGGTQKDVDKYQQSISANPPKQGGVFVSNDKVNFEAKTPEFHGADMAAGSEMVKKYGLGGAGIPDWFMGDSGSGNRSTATEMNGPTGKKFKNRQNHLVGCIDRIISFVLSQAKQHGTLAQDVDTSHTVEVPEMMVRDLTNASTALAGATNAIALSEDRGWIRGETAARGIHIMLSEIGISIDDSKEEYEAAQQELQERQANKQNNLFPQDALASALGLQQQNPGGGADPNATVDPAAKSAAQKDADGMVE